ncbi:hypothetical protein LTR10_017262 [Elasticomyces elasticus]|uniref:BZIP domain-containing protein n=1 Tax=Exophiala sideris TaxID=1016849 RepID=A0ABR0JHV2_9EURO|nr:hypothetical protein LTR10_017262 [Elasticomyces elasticus]KAK5034178.1 hypothetical protein LTS07_003098 [Exophiala sideris]KAK5042474.1 hypothetical protein LTR13_001321 [Exophiala sideris]KAK5065556.1 hypothetical protein LTR69_003105 [Exophiala sideris]KAK5185986.1 hypothetical protein LTR44_002035 [Eurotiomycetes sp. CCFEE 6388]
MATLQSGPSSAVDSINDLDGYTLRDYNFPSANGFTPGQDDDFGFDPPAVKAASLNNYQTYSPPNDLSLPEWPDFQREDDLKPSTEVPLNLDAYEMDKFINSTLPNSTSAVARYGQMTPPRSNSASSNDSVKFEEKALSPKSAAPEAPRRKRTTSGRKRKSSKKSVLERSESPEEQKRKQSLEKNRLAAAKCRTNKKEKTEQLQRDSHDKAVQNAYLKDQVMRMKDEIQQMNAILLAHANCDGCRSPEEIQAHLSNLGNDFFSSHMSMGASNYQDYSQMNFPDLQMMPDSYFPSANHNAMLNPPLPEFNRTGEFEVTTPMQTD